MAVLISVTTTRDGYDASLDTSLTGRETLVRRESVTAESDRVVTLAVQFGSEGESMEFQ